MGALAGILLIVSAWLGGLAFWAYAFIVWGIFQIVHGIAAVPLNAEMIGWGIAWIFLSKIIAAVIIWIGTLVGMRLIAASNNS